MGDTAAQDGAEDVSDFLRRIKELGDTNEEDGDLLEQEILESRRLRQARREERARSLSPDKQPLSPSLRSAPRTAPLTNHPVLSPSESRNITTANRSGANESKEQHAQEEHQATDTLSQQAINAKRYPGDSEDIGSQDASRASIAQSLAKKDPSWFRQTPDRGTSSAALRHIASDSGPNQHTFAGTPFRLHGLDTTGENRSEPTREPGVTLLQKIENAHPNKGSLEPAADILRKGPLPTSSSPERASSPTKGMGGFVQSAMLRRNESVNKRWSAQNSPGLGRQSSSATAQSGHARGPSSTDNIGDGKPSDVAFSNHGSMSRRSRSPTKRIDPSLDTSEHSERTPASSPSKRWSPMKSTWLESALNKPPESPRSARTTHSQPAWLSDLNKNRRSRVSKDETSEPTSYTAALDTSTEQPISQPPEVSTSRPVLPSSPPSAPSPKPKPSQLHSPRPDENEVKDGTAIELSPAPSQSGATAQEGPVNRSSGSHASLTRIKPSTPPKKDVHAIPTKPATRPTSVQVDKPQLEFQNAFGRLKRAYTQNYVAPDELKDNILRGKSGLNVTGGPKKTERVDEFKESLLRSKASREEKAKDPQPDSKRASQLGSRNVTPEAIAKRRAMQSESQSGGPGPSIVASKPQAPSPKPEPSRKATLRQSVSQSSDFTSETSPSTTPTPGSKLANRFNPALAGMIARGPPAASAKSPAARSPVRARTGEDSKIQTHNAENSAGGQLDHMTKSRARGPKRRPPKHDASSEANESSARDRPIQNAIHASDPNASATIPLNQGIVQSSMGSSATRANNIERIVRAKPPVPAKGDLEHMKSPVQERASRAASDTNLKSSATSPARPQPPTVSRAETQSGNGAQLNAETQIASVNVDHSVTFAATRWAGKPSTDAESAAPTAAASGPVLPNEHPLGNGLGARERPIPVAKSPVLVNSPIRSTHQQARTESSISPPAKAAELFADKSGAAKQQLSPRSQTTDASQQLSEFFDTSAQAPSEVSVNVPELLSSSSNDNVEGFQTLDCDVSVLTGEGKRSSLPLSQQPILFDSDMYLIKHTVKDSTGGKRVEVYLRIGRSVSTASAEDGQLFARKFAKDSGGILQVVAQGKEPPRLFQALGDIVIARQGPSTREGPYLLCGRKHLGRFMAFDEVSYQPSSFCSGYSFVIQAGQTSQMYLWKGKGCSTDEVASAQMVSMNLSSSGEVQVIEEGSEPASFMDLFPAPAGKKSPKELPRSADHWRLKSQHTNYGTRLFHVSYQASNKPDSAGLERRGAPGSPGSSLWNFMGRRGSQQELQGSQPQRVHEIRPYCQSDLQADQVYVLDAFFEIYILVGPGSHSKWPSFVTALLFAQDYSILAAGIQDRPFVPVGTVVMQGAPRDLKACFRGWDEASGLFGCTAGQTASGKSLRIIPLSAALVAAKP